MSNKKTDQVAECCTAPEQSNEKDAVACEPKVCECEQVYIGSESTLVLELTKVLNGTGEFKDNKEFKEYLIDRTIAIITDKDAEIARLEMENTRLRKQCECLTTAICDAETRCTSLVREKESRDASDYHKYTRERLEILKEKGYKYESK